MNVVSAAFDEAYRLAPGPPPLWPAIDTTLMMAPRLRSIIEAATACEASTALVKLSANDLVEALLGDLDEAEPGDERPGVVDEDVDRPELGARGLHERANVVGAAHVCRERDRRAPSRHNPVPRRFRALPVAMVAERDFGAEIGERDRGRGADPR